MRFSTPFFKKKTHHPPTACPGDLSARNGWGGQDHKLEELIRNTIRSSSQSWGWSSPADAEKR
jgi:hypothetical protein